MSDVENPSFSMQALKPLNDSSLFKPASIMFKPSLSGIANIFDDVGQLSPAYWRKKKSSLMGIIVYIGCRYPSSRNCSARSTAELDGVAR